MKTAYAIAATLLLSLATSALAVERQSAPAVAPPAVTPEVTNLAAQIRAAVASSLQSARANGQTGGALELAVSGAVETVIATSGVSPASALAAMQLAMADEKCPAATDATTSAAPPPGCQAMADIADAIASAIGGPAALGGTGTVSSPAAGPPPLTPAGADYSN